MMVWNNFRMTCICCLAEQKATARRTRTHYTYELVIQTRLVVQGRAKRRAIQAS